MNVLEPDHRLDDLISAETDRPERAGADTSRWAPDSAQSFSTSFPTVGQSLERFELLECVGEGGFGRVFRAYDPKLEREVAIKVPRSNLFASEDQQRRFWQEARTAAKLEHSNICRIYEVGQSESTMYLVMALVTGTSLRHKIEASECPSTTAAAVVRIVALAIHAAHQQGIVHRDVKPDNIMIDSHGDPIVMDFGLARRLEGEDLRLTQTGDLLGTTPYMSPEQAAGETDRVGPASDIYGLGVVLYELLCGQRPFQGSHGEVLAMILRDPTPPLSTYRPGIDPRLEAICLRAMAKHAPDRFATMADFAAALSDWLSETDPDAPTQRRKSTVADSPVLPPRRRNRSALIAAAAAVPVLAIVAAIFYVQTDQGRLKIESSVDDVEVIVSQGGKEIKIVDSRSGSEIRLRSGAYELALKGNRNGVHLSADRIELSRGGETIVKIDRDASSSPSAKDPDRRAAEWMLGVGGRFLAAVGSGTTVEVRKAGDLPNQNFQITWIDLNNRQISDGDLQNLAFLESLHELGLAQSNVNGSGLRYLSSCPRLAILGLGQTPTNDKGLEEIAHLNSLRTLFIGETNVTDVGLRHLSPLHLEVLDANRTNISDTGLEALGPQPALRAILLDGTAVSNAGIEHLRSSPKLTKLSLVDTTISDAALDVISSFLNLEELALDNTRVTSHGLEKLQQLPRLKHLRLGGAPVHNFAFLAKIPSLEILDIPRNDGLNDEDIKLLRLPNLRELRAGFTQLSGRNLNLLRHLQHINLTQNHLTAEGLSDIAMLDELQVLWIPDGKLSDADLASLAAASKLESLSLDRTPITDVAVEHLRKITWLKHLELRDTKLTADGIAALRKALPNCEILSSFPTAP